MKVGRNLLFYISMALLAGVVSVMVYYLLDFVNLPYEIKILLSSGIGVSTSFIVEGKLKNKSLKTVLREIIPAWIGLAVAFIFIFYYWEVML